MAMDLRMEMLSGRSSASICSARGTGTTIKSSVDSSVSRCPPDPDSGPDPAPLLFPALAAIIAQRSIHLCVCEDQLATWIVCSAWCTASELLVPLLLTDISRLPPLVDCFPASDDDIRLPLRAPEVPIRLLSRESGPALVWSLAVPIPREACRLN